MSAPIFSLDALRAQTRSDLTNVTSPTLAAGPQPGSLGVQIAAAIGQGGYVESEHSYAAFGFVNGRLQIVGNNLDVTLIVPTHDHTGLKSSRVKEPVFVADSGAITGIGRKASLERQLTTVDAQLAAAKGNNPASPITQSLEQKDGALRAALAQVQVAPGGYGTPADVRGLIGNVSV